MQLLARIKKRVEVLLMNKVDEDHYRCEEALTHKVFSGFKNNFSMSGLGSLLDVLLDEGVDAVAAISAVVDLDGVAMVAKMNACTLRFWHVSTQNHHLQFCPSSMVAFRVILT